MDHPPIHLITPEYPPQIGGVSDYVRAMAGRLAAAGREVHVWAPGNEPETEPTGMTGQAAVFVHRIAGRWRTADRARLARVLDDRFPAPRWLVLHWVPHGYDPRGLAPGIPAWLLGRRRRAGDHVDLVIHEPGVAFERHWRQWVLAVLHRPMLLTLLGAAERVWLSTPAWEPRLRPWLDLLRGLTGHRPPVRWLPLLIDLPVVQDPAAVAAARAAFTAEHDGHLSGDGDDDNESELLGTFGTYGEGVARLLGPVLAELLRRRSNLRVVLLGRGGERFLETFRAAHPALPALADRVRATGETEAARLSVLLQACDLLLQPYPDGITTRRTSALAVLAHGRAMVTTTGHLTERELWATADACRVVTPGQLADTAADLLDDPVARAALGGRGQRWFGENFAACDYATLFAP